MIQAAQCAFDFEVEAEIGVRNRQAGREQAQRGVQGAWNEIRVKPGQTQGSEGIVAGEEFIAAVATQRHGDMTTRKTAEQPCGQERAVALRFIKQVENTRHDLQRRIEPERLGVVVGF